MQRSGKARDREGHEGETWDWRQDCPLCPCVVRDGFKVPQSFGWCDSRTGRFKDFALAAPRSLAGVATTARHGRRCPTMSLLLLTLNKSTSARLGEVGFLLILLAGIWIIASESPKLKGSAARMVVAGLALFLAGLLLLIATHWGKFG